MKENGFQIYLIPYFFRMLGYLELINCNEGMVGVEFYLINAGGQVFIISENTAEIISWYKTYHIGRDLITNMNENDIINFLNRLREEYYDNYVEE